jgi:predicted adenine nucleotide alpha hydrolase (AANH) superfamily ATPase
MAEKKKILLHTCCAPCAAGSWERLLEQGYEVTFLFSNSNIYPRAEYDTRLETIRKFADAVGVEFLCDTYDHDSWLKRVEGFEQEPEKGRRCAVCFEFNLGRAAFFAEKKKIENFTTTLTVSTHKESRMIFDAGERFSRYLAVDFKEKDGHIRSSTLCKEYGLYRQTYCGCEFSLRDRERRRTGE